MIISPPFQKNLKWTPLQDDTLIQLMLDQCKDGRNIKGGFTCEGWNLLTKEMKTQYGDFFSKDKLKNRFKTLKKTYGDLKAMLDLSGFGWDDTRKMVTAEPQVWKEYVAAHPKAAHYKNKTFPDWASLAIIFGDSVADGRDGFASNDPEPIETQAEEETQTDDMDNAYEENAYEDIDVSIGTNRRQRQMSTAMTSRHTVRNRSNMGQALITAVETIANAMSDYANKRAKERPDMDKCIAALHDVGLPNVIYFKALNVIEIERKAEFFLALPPGDREPWILSQLGIEINLD
ncbi:Myb/SANT-like domain-containing protein [Cinnamomum micranthum f. kanehirae]|uniref:Myb/SANT-like domain-containing protein n=1 Tax=Cinnamomum micranthum f. kanehirae TaxID=337451 RepID=A0A3S3PJR9_9MAGN|nr:Myb/SANT-like domain-containing protein [Cinnamomum micranthum f. kanehirae]